MKGTKMSKKAYRTMVREKRAVWGINPVTRIRTSGKIYCRNKAKSLGWDE